MSYSEEFKHKIIAEYNSGINTTIEDYIKEKGISKTTFYKWLHNYSNKTFDFIDVSESVLCERKQAEPTLNIVINSASIQVIKNYDEDLLLNIVRSLQKL